MRRQHKEQHSQQGSEHVNYLRPIYEAFYELYTPLKPWWQRLVMAL